MKLEVPAQRRDAPRERVDHIQREAAEIERVEADAAHAGLVQLAEIGVGDVGARHDDGTQMLWHGTERREEDAVVRAVDAGLDEHATLDSEEIGEAPPIVQRQHVRRVVARRGEGRAFGENVEVAIARSGGQWRLRPPLQRARRETDRCAAARTDRHQMRSPGLVVRVGDTRKSKSAP